MLSSCIGCNLIEPEAVAIEEVKGQVLLDGKPLAGAKVLFVPLNKKLGTRFATSQAITGADGTFELNLSDERIGAYVGRHNVLISKAQGYNDVADVETEMLSELKGPNPDLILLEFASDRKDIVPRFYNVETELTFQVIAGQVNEARFELTSIDPLLK